MQVETGVEIDAPLEAVWNTLVDVDRWPEWTSSITGVERLAGDPLALGARVRIKQPRMPALLWQVTDFRAGSAFTWQSTSGGVTTVASHVLTEMSPDRVRATLGVLQSGRLAPVIALLTGRTTRRYLHLEADGLKRRSEGH